MKSLKNFTVYQKSIQLLAIVTGIADQIPLGQGSLLDQLRRRALSILLNIAEGAGKVTDRDRQRYFSIARGSAFETYAALDTCAILKIGKAEPTQRAQELLKEIVAILTVLSRRSDKG